jgi:hypothetical protein
VGPVGGSRRGATLTTVLVALAFVVGFVRPWDWLGSSAAATASGVPGASVPATAQGSGGPGGTPGAPSASPTPAPGSDAAAAQTCAYPQSWRSATIQEWAGRAARVWTAVDATVAGGPLDPSIPFQVIAGDRFSALGWCAPVLGPDRPPESAVGRLFRIAGGGATEPPLRLLEPAAPNPLGELWIPAAAGAVGTVTWPAGRYVIELATPSGSWTRWIGIELRVTPQPVLSPAASAPSVESPAASEPPGGASVAPTGSG